MRRGRARVAALLGAALVATACSDEPGPQVTYGEVTSGIVAETVAAPATVEPRDRVQVTSPGSGVVIELAVGDGDTVRRGDLLLQLSSDAVDATIAQAEAAVEAAGSLGSLGSAAAALDLAPVYDTVADQLEALVPPLLDALGQQLEVLPEDVQPGAIDRITTATRQYEDTLGDLRTAEADARRATANANAAQREVVEAQREQAELALGTAQDRADDLLVTAPADGVVELSRGGTGGQDLGGLTEGLPGDVGDLGALLGGGGSTTSSSSGPVAVGSEVGIGQPLLTIFDLSAFRVATTIDEIDVVGVEVGQDVVVLVDAFPDVELAGTVEYVAIEPTSSPTGGVGYPVAIRLGGVPDGVRLRVGLSGSAEVTTREVSSDTVVSSSALRRRGAGDVVYVVRDDVVREVDVVVDAIGLDTAAVAGDLETGEVVVVGGIDEVADGDPAPPGDDA